MKLGEAFLRMAPWMMGIALFNLVFNVTMFPLMMYTNWFLDLFSIWYVIIADIILWLIGYIRLLRMSTKMYDCR